MRAEGARILEDGAARAEAIADRAPTMSKLNREIAALFSKGPQDLFPQ